MNAGGCLVGDMALSLRAFHLPQQASHFMFVRLFAFFAQGVGLVYLLSGCQGVAPKHAASEPSLTTTAEKSLAMAPATVAAITEKASISTSAAPAAVPSAIVDPVGEPSKNIWPILRSTMALDHALGQRRVQQELRWLQDNPNYLQRLRPRLQKYLPYVLAQTQQRQLPAELTLIPIVESALDPYAFSHGGASGPWQFMRPTAKQYGLVIDRWYDGRRDMVAATDAALDYLQALEQRLGHWHLAIAAYNGGGARVARAVKKAASEDFFQLKLPRETSYYLPRVLALAALIADPETFALTLPKVENEQAFAKINLPGQYDLTIISKPIGLDYAQLKAWNPAFKRWTTAANGPHHIIVPRFADEAASQALDIATLETALRDTAPEKRMHWDEVVIQHGDSLSVLAERYNTDIATLRLANNLSGVSIRAGKTLLVPVTPVPMKSVLNSNDQSIAYTIRPGDSLWSIAQRHNVSVATLVKTNHVAPRDVLRVGKTINIPETTAVAITAVATQNEVIRKIGYRVRKGDSLARIAKRFQVSVRNLVKWNNLDLARYLQPGQRLTIYVNVVNT